MMIILTQGRSVNLRNSIVLPWFHVQTDPRIVILTHCVNWSVTNWFRINMQVAINKAIRGGNWDFLWWGFVLFHFNRKNPSNLNRYLQNEIDLTWCDKVDKLASDNVSYIMVKGVLSVTILPLPTTVTTPLYRYNSPPVTTHLYRYNSHLPLQIPSTVTPVTVLRTER